MALVRRVVRRWRSSADLSQTTITRLASSPELAYLDSSALVKLIVLEAETVALRRELLRWPRRVCSLLGAVEVTRTARRLGLKVMPFAPRVLSGVRLLAIDPVISTAMGIGGPLLRSLDAIHLASAAVLGEELGALITYDQRMLIEAQTLGLPVLCPR